MLAIASRRRTQVVKGEVCKTSMQRFESARRLQCGYIFIQQSILVLVSPKTLRFSSNFGLEACASTIRLLFRRAVEI